MRKFFVGMLLAGAAMPVATTAHAQSGDEAFDPNVITVTARRVEIFHQGMPI